MNQVQQTLGIGHPGYEITNVTARAGVVTWNDARWLVTLRPRDHAIFRAASDLIGERIGDPARMALGPAVLVATAYGLRLITRPECLDVMLALHDARDDRLAV